MSNVRFREDVGWEVRCPDCAKDRDGTRWWPLTDEFWNPRNMARCRSCTARRKRLYEERNAKVRREYLAAYRAEARDAIALTQQQWYEANKAHVVAYKRGWRAKNRERYNASARARYAARKVAA